MNTNTFPFPFPPLILAEARTQVYGGCTHVRGCLALSRSPDTDRAIGYWSSRSVPSLINPVARLDRLRSDAGYSA